MTSLVPSRSTSSTADPARLLKAWGRFGARFERRAAALGVAQHIAFVIFAWGAASAISALVDGRFDGVAFLVAVLGAAVRAALQAGETRSGFEASAHVRGEVRRQAAHALARQGPAFVERTPSGETSTALMDAIEKLDGYFGRYRPLMPVVGLGPLVILAAAFTQSWVVGVIFLATAPTLIIFMALVGAGAAAASKDQLSTLKRLAGRFNDRLQALETLNAFNAVTREREGLAAASEDFRARTMKVLAMAFLSSAILEFFAAVAVAGTAIYVGFSLLGELPFDAGEMIDLKAGLFVLLLAPEFYNPLRRLSAAYHDRTDAEAGAEVLVSLFDEKPGTGSATPHPTLTCPPTLRFKDAGSIYADGRRGLEPASFTAEAGQITALWGSSGVGKSTAMKLLLGYAPLSEGAIEVDDEPLAGPLIGSAAWISQKPRVFHGTIRENITLFDPSIGDTAVMTAAEQAGVMDFARGLPKGLDTAVGERGHGLSGGQAQRVSLARALAVDMKLLLLDEPTAHLDGEAEARFLDALCDAAKGRTVLIATHSSSVRARCDAVIELGAAS